MTRRRPGLNNSIGKGNLGPFRLVVCHKVLACMQVRLAPTLALESDVAL